MGLKAVGLTTEEIMEAIDLYNCLGSGGAYAHLDNYDNIVPKGLRDTIKKELIDDEECELSYKQFKLIDTIYNKLTEYLK